MSYNKALYNSEVLVSSHVAEVYFSFFVLLWLEISVLLDCWPFITDRQKRHTHTHTHTNTPVLNKYFLKETLS
jgi:hypothetical protein